MERTRLNREESPAKPKGWLDDEKPTKPNGATAQPIPPDAADIAALWTNTDGDPLAETQLVKLKPGKPKDFFRTHPDPKYRVRTVIYTHKTENSVEPLYPRGTAVHSGVRCQPRR
jgi:hypothetical protein